MGGEQSLGRAPGAHLRSLRRTTERAAVRLRLSRLLAVSSRDHAATLRHVWRPTRAARSTPNPRSQIPQKPISVRGVLRKQQRSRSRARCRRVRGYPARDHSRLEVRRPYFAGAAIGRADAAAWERSSEGRGLRRAGPASLATRIPARIQSGTRTRAPSGPAGDESSSSASRNSRAGRALGRSASRERHRRLRDTEEPILRSCDSGENRVAGRRCEHHRRDFRGVRSCAERKGRVCGICSHRRASRHPAAPQPALIPSP